MSIVKQAYSLTVECPDTAEFPAILRIRHMLKNMLRSHSIRCVTISEVPPLVSLVASTITRQPSMPIDTGDAWDTGAGG